MLDFWEKDIETILQKDLQRLQMQKLQKTLQTASQSYYYKKVFNENHFGFSTVTSLDDIRKIPFTTKENLQKYFPYGFLSAEKKDVVRLHSSSCTTGDHLTVVFYTRNDLDSWSNLVARSLYTVGVRNTDVFQNSCGYGLFAGGIGIQTGAEKIGALVVPSGTVNTKRQIQLMIDFGATVLHTLPGYVTRLIDVFNEMNLNPKTDIELRIMIIGAELHSEEKRQMIQEKMGVKAFNSYGVTELNGPGIAIECEFQNGMHVWEDSFLFEIIDPKTLLPVENNSYGELVVTTLDRRAMPLLRFRTGDITRVVSGTCDCGRTHRRIDRIKGRTDNVFFIKGCKISPEQIEKVLSRVPEVGNNFIIVLDSINGKEEMIIEVEVNNRVFFDHYSKLEKLTKYIIEGVKSEVMITPKVKLMESNSLTRCDQVSGRVRDLRKEG